MALQLVRPANAEPLSLIEAKTHLRVYDNGEDALIAGLIGAVRARAENELQCPLVSSRWRQVGNAFPGPSLMGVAFGEMDSLPSHAVQLTAGAVLKIVAVNYLAMDGTKQTMPASDYALDLSAEPARITPKFGKIWPVTLPQIGAVEVIFDAGHCAPVTAVNAEADTVAIPRWATLAVGDPLRIFKRDRDVLNDAVLPGGLVDMADYFVETVVSSGVYTLVDANGAHVDITGTGQGDLFVGEIPPSVKAWMLIVIGTLYENRQTITVDAGITLAQIPDGFLDGLLDPHRMVTYP